MSTVLIRDIYALSLLVPLVVPPAIYLLVRNRCRGLPGIALVVVISSVAMSGIVAARVAAYNWYIEQQVAPLDRNGDGIWTDEEEATWTARDYENMRSYVGDGGRNVFAAIIFPLFSLAYSTFVTLVAWSISRSRRRAKEGEVT